MDYCNLCGSRLRPGAKFCTECGARIETSESQKSEPLPAQPVCREPEPTGIYERDYAQAESTDKATRVILLTTVAVLAVGILLLSCILVTNFFQNRSITPEGVLGRYDSIACRFCDIEIDADGEWIELKSGGKAVLYLMEQEYTGKWQLEGNDLTIYQGDDTFRGSLNGDIIKLTFDSYEFTYCKAGSTGGALPDAEPQSQINAYAERLTGDWYGWWIICDGTGEWKEYKDNFWDACALIELYEEDPNAGYFLFWDEDSEADECVSSVDFHMGTGNKVIPDSGFFWDADLEDCTWELDADGKLTGGITDMICVKGSYVDPENSANTLSYNLYLRPWGEAWEDLRGVENADYPYDDMMPNRYDDWYLPLIRAGKEMPMAFEDKNP